MISASTSRPGTGRGTSARSTTGRRLFWAGLGCVVLTVGCFLGAFLAGNSFSAQVAMGVLLAGLVLSVIASLVAAVIGVAGVVAFPALRGRYILVLVLAILCSPLLWLVALALLS